MARLRTIGVIAIASFLLSAPTALGGTPTTTTTAAVADGGLDPDLDRQIESGGNLGSIPPSRTSDLCILAKS
jgi:hypothetical protein